MFTAKAQRTQRILYCKNPDPGYDKCTGAKNRHAGWAKRSVPNTITPTLKDIHHRDAEDAELKRKIKNYFKDE
ncbi:MAG: hypothetical protein OEN52_12005 [Gammaproteobacteria bacterium]|nr:hypothetical protein [Gammaproteobacteria bacterium]